MCVCECPGSILVSLASYFRVLRRRVIVLFMSSYSLLGFLLVVIILCHIPCPVL